jgi:hypothetical protein
LTDQTGCHLEGITIFFKAKEQDPKVLSKKEETSSYSGFVGVKRRQKLEVKNDGQKDRQKDEHITGQVQEEAT